MPSMDSCARTRRARNRAAHLGTRPGAGVVSRAMTVLEGEATHGLSREFLELFDLMKECLALYTRDGRILFVNPATCRLLGSTREALVGRVLWDLYPEIVNGEFYAAFQRVAATSEPQHFEFPYPPFGRVFANSIYAAGSTLYVVGRDVTEEHAATERLAILAEAARESERRKDEFLAMLGH